jgi:hypothetical protein
MNRQKGKIIGAVLAAWAMLVFAVCPDEDETTEGGEYPSPPVGEQGLCYYVSSSGDDTNNGLTEGNPFQTLYKAYSRAATDPDRRNTVVVLSNLESADAVSLTALSDTRVVIKGKEAGIAITRNAGANDSVLEIMGSAKIRFENITVNGKTSPTVYHRAMTIAGVRTEVTLGNGAVITGKITTGGPSNGGSGIHITDGAWLLMNEGSAVTGCEGNGPYSSGIYVHEANSLLTINDGAVISDNTSDDDGGGVHVYRSASVVMQGGTIRGNKVTKSSGVGGGVCVTGCLFAMYGGTIYGSEAFGNLKNTAGGGGAAVYGGLKKNGVTLGSIETTITAP